jgi:acetoacetyl-CoA reductase
MARIALVTRGVTGIGAATCKALKGDGHTVAANYFGNAAVATVRPDVLKPAAAN